MRQIRAILALTALIVGAALPLPAQLAQYKPFTQLRVLQTDKFDLIFPPESEPSARLLATYCDRVYAEIASLLGIEVPGRIPVSFVPHTDSFNGHYNPFSRPHIVLFDTPLDIEWTTFSDNLKSLFIHELTHAVSLNTRSPFYRFMHRIFGGLFTPAFWNAPWFMVEGVTVSFESLSGFGRANDPLVRQHIRQDLYEGRFLSPFQASGVYDLPLQGTAYYEYGGLFSFWLQETYGMARYARLWQAMGYDAAFSFFVYRSDYYRIFRQVYDMDFIQAWQAFGASLAIDGLEENTTLFTPRRNVIDTLAARGSYVYMLEGRAGIIDVYDTLTGKTSVIKTDTLTSYDIDVDAEGTAVLLSGYRYSEDRFTATVTEFDLKGRKTARYTEGLYKARYFRDGLVGIESNLHNTQVVYEDSSGRRQVLLSGNEELSFSGPQVIDRDRIALVASVGGKRELWLYHYDTGELYRVEGLSTEDGYQPYIRDLRAFEGTLYFSHNSDDRMYKLARLDLDTLEAVYSARDFSGGIFSPVYAAGSIYYRGAFSGGDGLLRFPEAADRLSGTRDSLRLERLNTVYSAEYAGDSGTEPTKPYIAARYMSPFNFWLPLPLLRFHDDSLKLDGGGTAFVILDPAERNLIIALAFADMYYQMAHVELFTWQNTALGFPLTLDVSDVVMDSGGNLYRDTRGSLSSTLTWSRGRWSNGFSLGSVFARFADYEAGKSAYQWEETRNVFALSAGLVLSNRYRRSHEVFGTGLSLNLRAASTVDRFEPQAMGMIRLSAQTGFPVNLALYGAYDKRGMNIHGISTAYGRPIFADFASTEYPHPEGLNLTWLGGGEASVGLFSIEVQSNVSHLYVNRIFGTLALRSVLYDGKGRLKAEGVAINDMRLAQSVVCKLGTVLSLLPVKQVPVSIEPDIWGAWKFSNTITGQGAPWYVTVGLSVTML